MGQDLAQKILLGNTVTDLTVQGAHGKGPGFLFFSADGENQRRFRKLGNPHLKADNRKRIREADQWAKGLRATLKGYKAQHLSQRAMADELNAAGVPTRRGGTWSLVQVQRVLKRLEL